MSKEQKIQYLLLKLEEEILTKRRFLIEAERDNQLGGWRCDYEWLVNDCGHRIADLEKQIDAEVAETDQKPDEKLEKLNLSIQEGSEKW